MQQDTVEFAGQLMQQFAEDTGLLGMGRTRRYLWTDAFAVGNFAELHRRTGLKIYADLAERLIGQVHQVLGRHREDDWRTGWISGLPESEGNRHPTAGGLRIGKELPERSLEETFDQQLEWERDGQYYHYLTKWMQVLHVMSSRMARLEYQEWAVELARTAHSRFTYLPEDCDTRRMYWKMSIDLSHPLLPSMGLHDPLDGYITFLQLKTASPAELGREINELQAICSRQDWTTDDPLGIGGLLSDSFRITRLMVKHRLDLGELMAQLLTAAVRGLGRLGHRNTLLQPARYRLAFRELGLSIGLHAQKRIEEYLQKDAGMFDSASSEAVKLSLRTLAPFQEMSDMIERFWQNTDNQQNENWTSHRDINNVMLVTSLIPETFFGV